MWWVLVLYTYAASSGRQPVVVEGFTTKYSCELAGKETEKMLDGSARGFVCLEVQKPFKL